MSILNLPGKALAFAVDLFALGVAKLFVGLMLVLPPDAGLSFARFCIYILR